MKGLIVIFSVFVLTFAAGVSFSRSPCNDCTCIEYRLMLSSTTKSEKQKLVKKKQRFNCPNPLDLSGPPTPDGGGTTKDTRIIVDDFSSALKKTK